MENIKSARGNQKNPVPAPVLAHDGAQVFTDIAAFIRRYLLCRDHQLTILTLWAACTECHHHFSTAPYLHVRSPQPHSGKSLCLNILRDLSSAAAIFTGVTAPALIERLIQGQLLDPREKRRRVPFTVLIDDCQISIGSSERQSIVSLLNSGSDVRGFFPRGREDYSLFGPKALAGNSRLPGSLAARCIPIDLRRPKPSEEFDRYQDVNQAAETLRNHLGQWLHHVSAALAQAARNRPQDLPPALSPGQIRCAEPLVHIADVAGGAWPERVRRALAAVFDLADAAPELQMLFDLRNIFHSHNNPECLSTSDLLSALRTLDSRPWSAWNSNSGRRLAAHLRPFGITSRRFHLCSGADFMGYCLAGLQDAWERYLPASSIGVDSAPIEVSANGSAFWGGSILPSSPSSSNTISAIDAASGGREEFTPNFAGAQS